MDQSNDYDYADCLGGNEVDLIASLRRQGRAACAKEFRREYRYGPNIEGRTCVGLGGVYDWSEISSGIMWVGVHGNHSICVVTKAGDLDVKRVHNSLVFHTKEVVLQRFRRTVISELEDLADCSSKLRKNFGPTIKAPFGVVSGNPGTGVFKESVYESYGDKADRYWTLKMRDLGIEQASSDEHENVNTERDNVLKKILEQDKINLHDPIFSIPLSSGYDETQTIMYLLKNMKTNTTSTNDAIQQEPNDELDEHYAKQFLLQQLSKKKDFSVNEIIQMAVSAFQILLKKELSAIDIEVSVVDPYFVASNDVLEDLYVRHLKTCEIEPYITSKGDDSPPTKKCKITSSSSSGTVD